MDSTKVLVNIGVSTRAEFGFGPESDPFIGATVVFVNCSRLGTGTYVVVTDYGRVGQQSSEAIPLTCEVTSSPDDDGDSNQRTSVVVTSAQSGQVGGQTVTLNSANFQSEQVGSANRNETLGGSAEITFS